MGKKEKKKIKLTTQQALDILIKNGEDMRKDINLLKEKKEEKQVSQDFKKLINRLPEDSGSFLDVQIKTFKQNVPEGEKELFLKELQGLMTKNGIYLVIASLTKKF